MAFEGKVRAFLEHFDKLEASNGSEGPEVGYYKEFMELKGLSQQYKDNDSFPADSGKLPCNKKKNRFKDILPFEHTRVVLHPEEDVEGSDYINANYITDAKGDVTYIASQGPLPHTVNDFWRMIWYHNIEVVVMACREYEMGKHKCERYWPDKGEIKMFGPIKVTTISENNVSNDFVIREIQAQCQGETQKMRQYHYNAWPDHLKPTAVYPIIRMIEVVHEQRTRHEVPIVVHCSAGCGRTGTIIAIDILRSIILNKDAASELSVFDIVKTMRMQRPAMVQAKDQYHFVYQAASMIVKNVLDGKKSLQKPPVSSKPGSSLSAGGPSGSSEESGKSSPNPAIIYENTTVEDVPKPMPRKKSTKAMEKSAGESKAPVPPPKPAKTPDVSPKLNRAGPPPEPPKKPASPRLSKKDVVVKDMSPILPRKMESTPKKVDVTPKKPVPSPSKLEGKKTSIMDLLMQECGDLLEEDTTPTSVEVTPTPVKSPPTIVEETDAPSIPHRTVDSFKLVESTYEVPGSSYEVPDAGLKAKLPPPPAPPHKPTSAPPTPVAMDTPPELPPARSPPQTTPPPQTTTTPSSALSSGGNGSSSSSGKIGFSLSKILSANKKVSGTL
jgi:tyrosine-protein phosphatase non-receptor type 12/18/22